MELSLKSMAQRYQVTSAGSPSKVTKSLAYWERRFRVPLRAPPTPAARNAQHCIVSLPALLAQHRPAAAAPLERGCGCATRRLPLALPSRLRLRGLHTSEQTEVQKSVLVLKAEGWHAFALESLRGHPKRSDDLLCAEAHSIAGPVGLSYHGGRICCDASAQAGLQGHNSGFVCICPVSKLR